MDILNCDTKDIGMEINKQIIQKYINLTSQKIYDCFVLENQLDTMIKTNDYLNKEIERLQKLLDDNDINYKTDNKGDEVALSPVDENVNETKEEN